MNKHTVDVSLSLIYFDLKRYGQNCSVKEFIKSYFLFPGFKYICWLRLTLFFRRKKNLVFFHYLCRYKLHRLKIKFGINIPYNTKIGEGFYIGHIGGITVNHKAILGKNCNISSGVVIGETFRGKRQGTPIIGDYVYIGPGAKIIGNISIGDNVAIGANAVITKSVPSNSVAIGIPGRVISEEGSNGYVQKVL